MNPPVIIFQADHGTTFGRVWTDGQTVDPFELICGVQDCRTLIPSVFPKPFTFVNTFPLDLNEVFGTEYEFQEDLLFELTII